MAYNTAEELNEDLITLNFELSAQELAWLKEHYGEELAEEFSKKKKIKKQIWVLMQNNNVLKALIQENRILKKQASRELQIGKLYNAKLYAHNKQERTAIKEETREA